MGCAGRSGRPEGPGTGAVTRLGGSLPRLTWAVGAGVGGKRVSGRPSALECPRLVAGWGSRMGPVDSPGAPWTRADDLREGHFLSDPFWEGVLGSASSMHPPTRRSQQDTHDQTCVCACACVCVCGGTCVTFLLSWTYPCHRLGRATVDETLPPSTQEPLNDAGRLLPGRPSVFQTPPCVVYRI